MKRTIRWTRTLVFSLITLAMGCGGGESNNHQAATAPSITTQPGSRTVTVGQTATFAVVASGSTPLGYQWHKSGADIAGATSASYTTPVATTSDDGATFTVTVSNSVGRVTSDAATLTVTAAVTAARPAYNTGTGFFVVGDKLYDSNGVEFRIRGVDKCHYDADWPGIPETHANTIRWAAPLWNAGNINPQLMQESIDRKVVPMLGVWALDSTYTSAASVTCHSDVDVFNTAVSLWVAQVSAFKTFEKHLLVDIANEWGPANSTVWRDAYIDAIGKLRRTGYLGTLVVDSGGCGQDPYDVITYGQAVFDSDPQRNVVFDVHIYGGWANGDAQSWQVDLDAGLDGLKATGLPIIIGEFGPGRNIGPSPTMMTPATIIHAAEAREIGWIAWAWDDPAYNADDSWFALSINGAYNSSADLTTFGKEVVEDPTYGLLVLGRPATDF